ncbi:hypothetical protein L0F63_007482 [Massospora cicadina]|nr:hypothetical protein L0F63_007482 [Massospora cicadina]
MNVDNAPPSLSTRAVANCPAMGIYYDEYQRLEDASRGFDGRGWAPGPPSTSTRTPFGCKMARKRAPELFWGPQ